MWRPKRSVDLEPTGQRCPVHDAQYVDADGGDPNGGDSERRGHACSCSERRRRRHGSSRGYSGHV
jgi:hypothetical protein